MDAFVAGVQERQQLLWTIMDGSKSSQRSGSGHYVTSYDL